MFRPINGAGVRVPEGISRLKSLQTLEGIYTGGSISKELGVPQMILNASKSLQATWHN